MRLKLLIFLAVACAFVFASCSGESDEVSPDIAGTEQCGASEEPIDESPDAQATFRRTTLYYLSDEGFVVPVTKLIPWEDGIARACLTYMVSTPTNLSAAREMGLTTVIPDGVDIKLYIKDGNALVDICNMSPLKSKESEYAMIQSIVNTLTEFPTVSTVTITRDGAGGKLENGTELPVRQEKYPLNPDNEDIETSAGNRLITLYFPNLSGALTVPVTHSISMEPNVYSVVSALVSGPKSSKLLNCFPKDTLLLGATIENGVMTINLSEDFKSVAQTEGMFRLAYRTVWLTLSKQYDFDSLRFQVNGTDFCPEEPESTVINPFGK